MSVLWPDRSTTISVLSRRSNVSDTLHEILLKKVILSSFLTPMLPW